MKKIIFNKFIALFIILSFSLHSLEETVASSNEVCPIPQLNPEQLQKEHTLEKDLVDFDRELKDFNTGFVVNEFSKTPDTLYNFMKFVYTTIDESVASYRKANNLPDDAVIFIFKGGNVLRMVANGLFDLVTAEARDLLTQEYAQFFKRSDADFSIFVNDKKLDGLDYEKVMDEIAGLTYQNLNKIRDEFQANPHKYFNFFQLKTEVADKVMQSYFSKLPELQILKDEKNENWFGAQFVQLELLDAKGNPQVECPYSGQYDVKFDFTNAQRDMIVGKRVNNEKNWILNTSNKTLEFLSNPASKDLIKFYLVRSKIQFYTIFEKDGKIYGKPFGGELIDVSMQHKDDFRQESFFEHVKRDIADYTLTFDDDSFSLKAESIPGLAGDLRQVVFGQFSRPWEGSKYEKRVNRLFFLAIVEMLGNYGIGNTKLQEYLTQIQDKIITPLERLYPINADTSANMAHQVLADSQMLSQNWSDLPETNTFLNEVAKVAVKELILNPKESDQEEFSKLLATIQHNLEIMSKLTRMSPMNVDITQIYNAKMKHLF